MKPAAAECLALAKSGLSLTTSTAMKVVAAHKRPKKALGSAQVEDDNDALDLFRDLVAPHRDRFQDMLNPKKIAGIAAYLKDLRRQRLGL